MVLTDLWDRLVSLLYPQRCVICDDVVEYDDLWCGACPVPRLGVIEQPGEGRFGGVMAALVYSGRIRQLIWRIKDSKDKRVLAFFAGEIADAIGKAWPEIHFDLIVPVPTTRAKLRERGFNQAEELGHYLCKHLDIPQVAHLLARREDTQTQHELTKAQRRENAMKSFTATNAEDIRGKTILLIDDVITTGATITACATRLAEAGANTIYIASAAYTELESLV